MMAAETHGKLVELFRDMLPAIERVAVLTNAADPVFAKLVLEQVELARSAFSWFESYQATSASL
jgi:hypothetical protein